MSDENHFCVRHNGNEGSLLSTYKQLKTCIDWLARTCVTDETVLAFSDLTSMIGASGGNNNGTIRMVSPVSKILSFITDGFDFIKNFFSQNISATGANSS
eukprot:SAG11_NODE_4847_length_1747_cov_17.033374_1_plen_99_part_10